ncbi:MAG: Group 2 truncated hemoglobin GlbO [Candidatus Heimdallarchaeota archaeon LC_3]|nr:MAG: Group 2 truncated hemoglobin GlbO [Candidatus Heimdallarchaeota archaeon LC_3]
MNKKIHYSEIFSKVGGSEFFRSLVDIFYNKIENDLILRPIFPESLEAGRKWQYLFLQQFFGGPREYEQIRGHPRLRKRHLPFPIGIKERNQWVTLILESIEELGITKDHELRFTFEEYFERTATKLMNKDDPNELVPFLKDTLN